MKKITKTKLLIATPSYDKKVHAHYTISLIGTKNLLESQGIEVDFRFRLGDSLLVSARNGILQDFWESDATHILCIDSDIGWPPLAVLAMLQSEKDFIAGVYPTRWDNQGFFYTPCLNENGNRIMEGHLIKMEYIPAGFMLFSKKVISKMRDVYPELYYKSKHDSKDIGYCFFDTEVYEQQLWGEDYVFARRVRNAGFDIWVDPLIEFKHGDMEGAMGRLPSGENPYSFKS
jgi:hypothetical protein